MKIQLRDGKILEAEDVPQFLNQFRVVSFTRKKTLRGFMGECARRAANAGYTLPTTDENAFFQGLLDIGEIQWAEDIN